jgi:two-component system nitrate/nitrite response regulator NarL
MDTLTPRERQIMAEIARGASNKEIAQIFSIAEATVKIHVQRILRKLNLNSRVQAAVHATRAMSATGQSTSPIPLATGSGRRENGASS